MKSTKEIDAAGTIRYRNENGYLHREDGPALERNIGTKSWWINGLLHREDGPARIYPNGNAEYWLNNKYYSKNEHEQEVIKLKLKRIKDL